MEEGKKNIQNNSRWREYAVRSFVQIYSAISQTSSCRPINSRHNEWIGFSRCALCVNGRFLLVLHRTFPGWVCAARSELSWIIRLRKYKLQSGRNWLCAAFSLFIFAIDIDRHSRVLCDDMNPIYQNQCFSDVPKVNRTSANCYNSPHTRDHTSPNPAAKSIRAMDRLRTSHWLNSLRDIKTNQFPNISSVSKPPQPPNLQTYTQKFVRKLLPKYYHWHRTASLQWGGKSFPCRLQHTRAIRRSLSERARELHEYGTDNNLR